MATDDQTRADKERAAKAEREEKHNETRQREDPSVKEATEKQECHDSNRVDEADVDKVRHIEHVEYMEGGVPSDLREVHPEDAHPQPDDGMDSPLADPTQIATNDEERRV